MTETPPEQTLPEPEPGDDEKRGDFGPESDPARDDGVSEDRLTGVAFYDTLEGRYVGGVHPNETAARKAEDFKGDRYVLRRV